MCVFVYVHACVCEDGRMDDEIKQVELFNMPFMVRYYVVCALC